MKKQLLTLILLLIAAKGVAEERDLSVLPTRWQEINMSGGLSNNGYLEIEPSYSYMLNRHLGLTAGINAVFGSADDDYYNVFTGEYEQRLIDIQTLLFRPSVRFRFPIAYQNKTELFALNIEPGVYIPLGKEKFKPNIIADQFGYKKIDWLYLNLKTAITLDICPLFLSIGYTVTDFSHEADKFRLTHSGFIQLGYIF